MDGEIPISNTHNSKRGSSVTKKIRVLVVDDSTVIRRLLTDILSSDPMIEVVGTAAHGKIALSKIPLLRPDLVSLDMEMPEMDGITTLVEIRKLYPKLPVVMFSSMTQRGAAATLDALAKGANDYVAKPASAGGVNESIQYIEKEMIPRVKALCGTLCRSGVSGPVVSSSVRAETNTTGFSASAKTDRVNSRVDAVVIGSSTGGPNALHEIIPKIPADISVPIVIVQHMPPIFTTQLASRLDELSPLRVVEAKQNDSIRPGGVWIAPGDFHLRLKRVGTEVRIQLDQGPAENSCRPAVDVLFRSAESVYGGNLLAVVLTGMGQDGEKGCETIHGSGGQVLIQNQETCVVWGMPAAVSRAGLATSIQPLSQIATEISRLSRQSKTQRAGLQLCR